MNVVDSSGWLEFFADGPNADFFAQPIQDSEKLIVPTLSLYEVFKHIKRHGSESDALQAVAVMQQGTVLNLTVPLALDAARISLEMKVPMAGSVMLATARAHGALLWTQDSDFEKIPGVRFVRRKAQKGQKS